MTGRDLIIYIMQNDLENETIFETMSEGEAAVKFGVGVASIRVWYKLGLLIGWEMNGVLLIWKGNIDPREKEKGKHE